MSDFKLREYIVMIAELRKVGIDVEFDTDCGGGHFPPGGHWWNVINPKEMAFFKRVLGSPRRILGS